MKKNTSLKDIAKRAGVSAATVSYVLNNKKLDRISQEIADRIRKIAMKLDYRPNQLARALKTRKTFTIGLIVADIANPFFSNLARVIEDEARRNNYTVIFASSDENLESLRRVIEVFVDHQVDGIIVAATEKSENQIASLRKTKLPLVLIDRYFPDIDANSVTINNYKASFEATEHLIVSGYKNIGILGFRSSLHHLKDRKRGFRAALKKYNLPVSNEHIKELALDVKPAEVEAAITELLSLRPKIEALFFTSSMLSIFGLKYLNTLPLQVPRDLAVLSFDQSDAVTIFKASVTHIEQPLDEIGRNAVQLLFNSMNGLKAGARIELDGKLVIGTSTHKTLG